jgi:hypothetical protein
VSSDQYEHQARALQDKIDRLEAEMEEAGRESAAAVREFTKVGAVTPRRDRNWLLFVLLNGDHNARDRYLLLRERARSRSSAVDRIVRDVKAADKELSELIVHGLRRYDNEYGAIEKELGMTRLARTACEKALGVVAAARGETTQAARSAPPRSRRGPTDPEVEQAAARVSAAVRAVHDAVDDVNRQTRSSGVSSYLPNLMAKTEFSGVRVDRSQRVSEFTRVGNALNAIEKEVQALRGKLSAHVATLEADLRRRRESERERLCGGK